MSILSREFICFSFVSNFHAILCTIKSHICFKEPICLRRLWCSLNFPLMTTCLLFCTIRRFSGIWKNTVRDMILHVISRYVFVFNINSMSVMKLNQSPTNCFFFLLMQEMWVDNTFLDLLKPKPGDKPECCSKPVHHHS